MRYHLHFQVGQLHEFRNRLYEMNKYLQYFPIPAGREEVTSLEDDELLEIIDRAKPMEYQQALLAANYDPYYSQTVVESIGRPPTSSRIRKKRSVRPEEGRILKDMLFGTFRN